MRYPDFLKENGTIGFVAPSLACASEPYKSAFLNAQKIFTNKGYSLEIGPNAYLQEGIGISNTPKLCAEELNEALCNSDSQVIISCGGGELMCEILPYIDYERIMSSKAKWFVGYSDNTNYTFLSATICDTAAIYGPCAAAYGMEPWHPSLGDTMNLLSGKIDTVSNYDLWEREKIKSEEKPYEPYNVTEPTIIRKFPDNDAEFSGRLLGGCIDCMVTFLGTRFDKVKSFNEKYMDDGIIWFMEACDLNVLSIRRAIWQMKEAGWFEHVKGFLIGRPYCFGEDLFGLDQYRAVTDLLAEYKVPIIMDLDIGHLPPMMPLICGATADVKVAGNNIEIKYSYK